jgi:hypothetical protein
MLNLNFQIVIFLKLDCIEISISFDRIRDYVNIHSFKIIDVIEK